MHGLGNDFMVLDLISNHITLTPEQIRSLANRYTGIGFDQLLQIEPATDPSVDFNYRIYNADGGEIEHCGNGARCFARFVSDRGLTTKNPIRVKTVNRVLTLLLNENGEVSVDMGIPDFIPEQIPFTTKLQENVYHRGIVVDGQELDIQFSALSMGNPHAVIIVEDIDSTAVKDIGEVLGAHPDFPEGVNVGYMQILSRTEVRLRVYERGVGETLSCGTGACAATVAGCLQGHLDDTVEVQLRGGRLTVNWRQQDSHVLMTGPVATVYEGSIQL
jgi:diaminopimelate epimerase